MYGDEETMQDFDFKMIDSGHYAAMRYTGDEAHVIVPETYAGLPVTVLFDRLFLGHPEITSIELPDGITDIGEFMFEGCDNLKSIRLPAQMTSMWPYAFAYSGFEEIRLPDGVTSIAPFAFKGCKNLKRVICGAGMRKIESWAFGGCDRLEEVICGPGVEISPKAYEVKRPWPHGLK